MTFCADCLSVAQKIGSLGAYGGPISPFGRDFWRGLPRMQFFSGCAHSFAYFLGSQNAPDTKIMLRARPADLGARK